MKSRHLGYFDDIEEAVNAYRKYITGVSGEFART
jgi:hypothetical protein